MGESGAYIMWEYNDLSLRHHGIRGMKWGVRRYQNADGSLTTAGKKRIAKADRAISRIESYQKINKTWKKEADKESRETYTKDKGLFGNKKNLEKSLALNKARVDTAETVNKYGIAVQKAKKDPSYKDTPEYKKAKSDYNKQYTQQYLFGSNGHLRIEQLKNVGYSEKKAKGRAIVEQLATMAVITAAVGGYSYLKNRG